MRTHIAQRAGRAVTGALVSALVIGTTALAGEARAEPASAASHGDADFNGDGYPDLAIAAPMDSTRRGHMGTVTVLYGSDDGISGLGSARWSGGSRGIRVVAPFSEVVGWGDFDGDGFDDLVVGSPQYTDGSEAGSGAVIVLPGSANGVTAAGSKTWTLASRGMPGDASEFASFGAAVTTADFNADGFEDLAVGADNEDGGAGAVRVLYGSASGLNGKNIERLNEQTSWPDRNHFGERLAAGDFNGDGYPELAVGAPQANVDDVPSVGQVMIFDGGQERLQRRGSGIWSVGHDGILGTAYNHDYFGGTVATGDLNDDGFADLVAARPFRSGGNPQSGGQVHVIYGSAEGLVSVGNQLWDQDSEGVPGGEEPGRRTRFGADVVVTDVNADGVGDLVVGACWDLVGTLFAGSVYVLPGSPAGVTARGVERWTQDSPGIDGSAGDYAYFGCSLAATDIGSDGTHDVVVGALDEDIGGEAHAGAAHIMIRSTDGSTFASDQRITQATPGVRGHLAYHRFGQGVAG